MAIEEGVVDDFLFSLVLEREGMSWDDVVIKFLEIGVVVVVFVVG